MRIDHNLVSRGEVLFQLELRRETKDSFKNEHLAALASKVKFAMANENLVVVVLKMPR